jgi:post-segregation antitoxin (ccd killing protein)
MRINKNIGITLEQANFIEKYKINLSELCQKAVEAEMEKRRRK